MNKKFVSATLLASVMAMSLIPSRSEAFYAVECRLVRDCDSWDELGYAFGIGVLAFSIVGIVLIPVVLLDGSASHELGKAVSEIDLQNNGYFQHEIEQIIQDQHKLALSVEGLNEVQSQNIKNSIFNKESLEKTLWNLDPTLSSTYLNFVAESSGY